MPLPKYCSLTCKQLASVHQYRQQCPTAAQNMHIALYILLTASSSRSGLWSSVTWMALPPLLSTARESPASQRYSHTCPSTTWNPSPAVVCPQQVNAGCRNMRHCDMFCHCVSIFHWAQLDSTNYRHFFLLHRHPHEHSSKVRPNSAHSPQFAIHTL